jgi:hypothetical protein
LFRQRAVGALARSRSRVVAKTRVGHSARSLTDDSRAEQHEAARETKATDADLTRESSSFTPSRRRGVFGVDESNKLEASPILVRLGTYLFESQLRFEPKKVPGVEVRD